MVSIKLSAGYATAGDRDGVEAGRDDCGRVGCLTKSAYLFLVISKVGYFHR